VYKSPGGIVVERNSDDTGEYRAFVQIGYYRAQGDDFKLYVTDDLDEKTALPRWSTSSPRKTLSIALSQWLVGGTMTELPFFPLLVPDDEASPGEDFSDASPRLDVRLLRRDLLYERLSRGRWLVITTSAQDGEVSDKK
jgi:hypothetical protein